MDSVLSVPLLTPFIKYLEWKLKMISSLKRQGLYEVQKFNPVIEQLHSQQLSIVHEKSLTKETEYGAEH